MEYYLYPKKKTVKEIRYRFTPSPALGYRLDPSIYPWHTSRRILPKECLFIDVVKYIEKRLNIPALAEVYDPLRILMGLLIPPRKLHVNNLYDLKWIGGEINRSKEFLGYPKNEVRSTMPYQRYSESDRRIKDELEYIVDEAFKKIQVLKFLNVREIIERLAQDKFPAVKRVRAALHIAMGQEYEAANVYQGIERMNPYDHYNLGNIYLLHIGDYGKAEEQFKRASKLKPDFDAAYYNLGLAYLYEGNWEDAYTLFGELSEKINPEGSDSPGGIFKSTLRRYSINNLGICSYWLSEGLRNAIEVAEGKFEEASKRRPPTNRLKNKESINNNILLNFISQQWGNMINEEGSRFCPDIIRRSEEMERVCEEIVKVAPFDYTVLITGETGTGKELVARYIHKYSRRGNKNLITVNCGSIKGDMAASEYLGHRKGAYTGAIFDRTGLLEEANDSSIFLDEIGKMDLGTQGVLIRSIEEKKVTKLGNNKPIDVNIRIIAATNKELREKVREGGFLEDFYARLEHEIRVPSLRERRADIEPLAEHFIASEFGDFMKKHPDYALLSRAPVLLPDALELLMGYDWPGNIRELKNAIENCFINLLPEGLGEISPEHLPEKIRFYHQEKLNENPAVRMIEAWEKSGRNILEASRLLSISKATFYRKAEAYGIEERLGIKKRK